MNGSACKPGPRPQQQRHHASVTLNIRPSTVISVSVHILQQNDNKPMHLVQIQNTMVDSGLITNCPLPLLEAILLKDIQDPHSKIKMIEKGIFGLTTEQDRLTRILQHSVKQQQAANQASQQSHIAQQTHSNSNVNHPDKDKFKKKYKRLRKLIKDQVFMNASLCDEVARVEKKHHRAKEERRFLLKKLYQYQALSDAASHITKQHQSSPLAMSQAIAIKKTAAQLQAEKSRKKSLKKKGANSKATGKKLCQPIPLKPNGQPVFPIELGNLTIHTLGQVLPDRVGFHTAQYIYPVGFVSSRIYTSWNNADESCCYVCKIMDGGKGPKFEILCDDGSDQSFIGLTASDCHTQLLNSINEAYGRNMVNTTGNGPAFFGFSHPTVQSLIQRLAGASQCDNYKWIKFEVCLPEQGEVVTLSDNDPTVNFDALLKSHAYKQGMLQQAKGSENKTLDDLHLKNLLSTASKSPR